MPFPIALSSACFQNLVAAGELNLAGYIELLHSRYRVSCADLSSALLPPDRLDRDYLWRIHDMLQERQISLSCLCVDGPQVWSDDPDRREQDRKLIRRYLEAARWLGARNIRVNLGSGAAQPLDDEAADSCSDWFKESCGFCQEEGMRIGPENNAGYALLPANLQRIRQAVDHPAYGHVLRVGAWPAGSGREMLNVILPDLMHTHFPAESMIWAKDLMRRIARTSYQGSYGIEQSCGRHEIVRAEWQVAVLRGLATELAFEGLEPLTPPGYFCQMAQVPPPDGILDI
jgi:hypothetical protein